MAVRVQPAPIGVERILDASAVKITNTGNTTENTVVTKAVPGGSLGANGYIEVLVQATTTSNANTKNVRVKYGGTQFLNIAQASGAGLQAVCIIQNRNSTSSQIGFGSGSPGFAQGVGAATSPGTVDSSVDQNITITLQCTTSGTDSIDLERYIIKTCYIP